MVCMLSGIREARSKICFSPICMNVYNSGRSCELCAFNVYVSMFIELIIMMAHCQ